MKRVSVIGYGFSGRSFHSYLVGLADGLTLDSIVEPDEAKRALAQGERAVKTYASVDEMIADGRADLAVIATPHDTHATLAVQLLDAGVDVVTDKAMCVTVAEADAMLDAARRNGRLLSVFHNRRWDWDFNTVRRIIAEGAIGEVVDIEIAVTHGRPAGWRANPQASGGFLYDWGSHLVDQALILGGCSPSKVYCRVRRRDGIDEHGRLVINFENGFSCSVEVGGGPGATVPKPHWFVLGTGGTLVKYGVDPQETAMRAGDIDGAFEAPDDRARVVTAGKGADADIRLDSVRTSWKSFYQNIADVLNGVTRELAVKPEGVRNVVAVLEAATLSARTGEAAVPDIRM